MRVISTKLIYQFPEIIEVKIYDNGNYKIDKKSYKNLTNLEQLIKLRAERIRADKRKITQRPAAN